MFDKDKAATILGNTTSAEFARYKRSLGTNVLERDGRFWLKQFPGGYQPLNRVAPVPYDEISLFSPRVWSVSAVLSKEESHRQNACFQVHMIPDLSSYSIMSLSGSGRRELKKAMTRTRVEFPLLEELPLAQMHKVYVSAFKRTATSFKREQKPYTQSEYEEHLRKVFDSPSNLCIAVFDGDNLMGFSINYSVDGIAYGDDMYVHDDYMRAGASRVLYHVFSEVCQSSSHVEKAWVGINWFERPGVGQFKKSMSYPLVSLPVYHCSRTIPRTIAQKAFPAKFARLFGHKSQ